MSDPSDRESGRAKFGKLLRFMLGVLPGWRWKLPLILLLGSSEIAILILLPLMGARIINSLVAGSWIDFRYNLILLAVLTITQLGVSLMHRYVLLVVDECSVNTLRQAIVVNVFRKPLQFFDRHWVGDLVSRAINDSSVLKGFTTGVLLQIIYDTVSLVVVTIILVRMNPVLAVLTMATAPITLLYGRIVSKRLEAATLRVRENVASVTGHLQSWLTRPFAIKAHSLESVASRRFRTKNDELTKNSVGLGLLGAKVSVISGTLLGIPSLLIFGYGGYITFKGHLSIGALFAFMTFSSYFNAPIQRLINIVVIALPTLYPVHNRIRQILISDEIEPAIPRLSSLPQVAQIRVADLSFKFEGESGLELIVPSFIARRGEIVGIVGANGSGKSSLARLLAGFYQPRSGAITVEIDDHKLVASDEEQQLTTDAGRRQLLGFLPQEVVVFDGTLLENITLFDSLPDEKRLARIKEELQMSEWINSLPLGLETEINAGLAMKFSGGQLQKIGLSRVLYRDPPVLLLDEPSNSLDRPAQLLIEQAVERARDNHVVILITHSADILKMCDRLYELESRPGEVRSFQCVERNRQVEMSSVVMMDRLAVSSNRV